MEEIIKQIEQALAEFASNDLCEGNRVRDVLLDILMSAYGQLTPPVGAVSRDYISEDTNAPGT